MKQRPAGYALVELLATISLLTVFLLVSGRLVAQVADTQRGAVRAEWATSRMDHALREIRKDVWDTAAVTAASDHAITLRHHDGTALTWSFAAEPSDTFPQRGWLTRQATDPAGDPPAAPTTRYEVPHAVRFIGSERPGLTVGVDHHTLWMPSQVMLGRAQEVSP